MAGPLRISPRIEIPESELTWRFSRSSGPGGQAVNTSNTRVELSFDVVASDALSAMMKNRVLDNLHHRLHSGVLTVVSSGQRSQLQNRMAAEARMIALLREATAPPARPRRPTRPSAAAKRERIESKRRRGDIKRGRRRPGADD